MNKSTAAIVWVVGLSLFLYIVSGQTIKNPGVWGSIFGSVWTALMIALTKDEKVIIKTWSFEAHRIFPPKEEPGVFYNGEPIEELSDLQMATLYSTIKSHLHLSKTWGYEFKNEAQAKQFQEYVEQRQKEESNS